MQMDLNVVSRLLGTFGDSKHHWQTSKPVGVALRMAMLQPGIDLV